MKNNSIRKKKVMKKISEGHKLFSQNNTKISIKNI